MNKNHSGFTIIELFVVVCVLAVMASLAVFAFQGATRSAQDAERLTELQRFVVGVASAGRDNATLCTADGTAPCRAGLMLHECRIYAPDCNGDSGSDVTDEYVGDVKLQDPAWTAPCDEKRRTNCGYTYSRYENIADFDIMFSTYSGELPGITPTRGHLMSQNGDIR